jgi:succinoglycan biosynthesis transport protein ExoP
MELIEYIRLFRKWWWLFLLAGLLAGGMGYLSRSRQPEVYQAEAMISVGGYIESPNPDTVDIFAGQALAKSYAVLAETHTVLEAAIEAGEFDLTADQLQGMLSTRTIEETSMLILIVTHTDPVLAADIANEIARQLVHNSPSNLTPEQQAQVDLTNREIGRLNTQLQDLNAQIQVVDAQLETVTDPQEIQLLQERRLILIDQINRASANLVGFSQTLALLQERTNSLTIVEEARVPTSPSTPGVTNAVLMGAIVGMVLVGGLVLLIEYLDDTIKSTEQATQLLGTPVLGAIAQFDKRRGSGQHELITLDDSNAPALEGYRVLRTNLLCATEAAEKRVYIVTSPGPGEGKSITAANLAVSLAVTGLRVLLIDADLRRPRQHAIFGLANKQGLTSLLYTDHSENQKMGGLTLEAWPRSNFVYYVQTTSVPGLNVLTSGGLPANPTELLGSAALRRWLNLFLDSNAVDAIIFDTPPTIAVADSTVLAATTGAPVIMVLEAGKTKRQAAQKAVQRFTKLGLPIEGIVLNRVGVRDLVEEYEYDGYYYAPESNEHQPSRLSFIRGQRTATPEATPEKIHEN